MSALEERPAGGQWLNNAELDERHRVACLEQAEKAEAQERPDDAAQWRVLADQARQQRDRRHAEGLRRQMNRRVRHGNW